MAVAFLLYVVAEVAAVWMVASLIGVLPMLALLLLGAFAGSWLTRREGGKTARAFMTTMQAGRAPHTEITDGMLIGFGGLLILLPGFISDIAGLLVLLPPIRGLLRRAWLRRVERRAPLAHSHRERVIVVDSEVVDTERNDPGQQPQRPAIESE